MAYASELLIEIACLDENTAAKTLYLSTGGYLTGPGDVPANQYYDARISSLGPIVEHIFDAGRTIGSRADVGYGVIEVSNADGGLDVWMDYAFDGRAITIKKLASPFAPYASAVTIFTGTIERLDADDAWKYFRLRLYDRRLEIDRPIQTVRYAGTVSGSSASAEGTSDLAGKVKPLIFGQVYNVPALQANPFDLIYQVNDGAVASIQVYDGGVALAAGSNYSSISSLRSASLTPGTYGTCLALGLFRLASNPNKTVTADVIEGNLTSDRYPCAIATRMLLRAGLQPADIDAASASAVDVSFPYASGIWIDGEADTIDAISKVLAGIGAWMVPNSTGVFTFGMVDAPSNSVFTIDYDVTIILTGDTGSIGIITNPDTEGGLPAWRITVNYQKNWNPLSSSEVHGCLGEDDRVFLSKEYRSKVAESAATKSKYLLSDEIVIDAIMVSGVNASAEALRRLLLYSVRRDVVEVNITYQDGSQLALGDTVTLKLPRFGYESGRAMLIIGREIDLSRENIRLTLWG